MTEPAASLLPIQYSMAPDWILIFAGVAAAWMVLVILGGERQRCIHEAAAKAPEAKSGAAASTPRPPNAEPPNPAR